MALDLATTTGWAAGPPCGPVVWGHFRCDATDHADRFLQMVRRVSALIDEHHATEVVLEESFVGRKFQDSALQLLFGYRAAAMIAARNRGVWLGTYEVGMIRKSFIGAGGFRRDDAKRAVKLKCEWHGLAPKTDDESDAIAAWSYRCSLISTPHLTMSMRRGALGAVT